MATANQLNPGMVLSQDNKLYRVESCVKVTVPKGAPFIKTQLKDIHTNKTLEKNFKPTQAVNTVALTNRPLEYLYREGKEYLFLDVSNLEQVRIPTAGMGEDINYLKEGTEVLGSFYGEVVFSVELPQFLELMVAETEGDGDIDELHVTSSTKMAILETGAKIEVPAFIQEGDVVKVDTKTHEYIQRV